MGQLLGFSEERIITLVACGAAAGIAATFNAPIAGAIFALEVILGSFTVRYFGAVVISSVTASVVSQIFLSGHQIFTVPAYPLNHLGEMPIYVVLGVLSAIGRDRSSFACSISPKICSTVGASPCRASTTVGMLLTGLLSLLIGRTRCSAPGLPFIDSNIAGNVDQAVGIMLLLLVGKLVATSLTLGSGKLRRRLCPQPLHGGAARRHCRDHCQSAMA